MLELIKVESGGPLTFKCGPNQTVRLSIDGWNALKATVDKELDKSLIVRVVEQKRANHTQLLRLLMANEEEELVDILEAFRAMHPHLEAANEFKISEDEFRSTVQYKFLAEDEEDDLSDGYVSDLLALVPDFFNITFER